MALVNVAVELASRGKKVLVVDFDLEAPGLTTFDLFENARTKRGVVDYVTDYAASLSSPNVTHYVEDCTCNLPSIEGKLWIMSAGLKNPTYPVRLNDINWLDLYESKDGYLFFEDLKNQWKQYLNPDYVLIDSRTGHTDIGGICTRQLPDAVALMFFPNNQNIDGLISVVADIRAEAKSVPSKAINMHFVLSNVPDLDDENGILHGLLDRAQHELNFDEPAAIIHHYNSLNLLSQTVFTQARPRSKLTQEYRTLTKAIVGGNIQDRDGALSTIREIQQILFRPGRKSKASEGSDSFEQAERQLTAITNAHSADSDILQRVATIHERLGFTEKALTLLNESISLGRTTAELYLRRASIYHSLGNTENSAKDFLNALSIKESNITTVLRAVRGLMNTQPEAISNLEEFAAFKNLEALDKLSIIRVIIDSPPESPLMLIAEKLLRGLISNSDVELPARSMAVIDLSIVYMTLGRFKDTMLLLEHPPSDRINKINDCFNYAMAAWGAKGKPEPELFERVIELYKRNLESGKRRDANYLQCISLAYNIAGDVVQARGCLTASRQSLSRMSDEQFSAWRYNTVPAKQFAEDLDKISDWINGEPISPPFLRNAEFISKKAIQDG